MPVKLDDSWKIALDTEFSQPYWKELTTTVREHYLKEKVYPPPKQIFRALDLVPMNKVKVVILGQDPYHGDNQANGLSFSVNENVSLPPSLQNIYKEIERDLHITTNPSGDLTRWANQGVLLLNSVLTVFAHQPASHTGLGWERFSDAIIRVLNQREKYIVYMLWGRYAQMKGVHINIKDNLVLTSGHPSPYSVHLFNGRHHFSQCNRYLVNNGKVPIDWH